MSGDCQQPENISGDMETGQEITFKPQFNFSSDGQNDFFANLLKQKLDALPESVKKRIKALKRLQFETTKIESKFHEEVYALELKYHQLYTQLYDKRSTIVTGKYEPTDEECDFPLADDLDKEVEEKLKIEDITDKDENDKNVMDDNAKGIPEFWLHIFKNVSMLSELFRDHDEPILKHLEDIKIKYLENQMGFTLEFYFSPNDYFNNSVLTKTYFMKCTPDEDDPFSFEGAEIYKCAGCTIDWKKGKNVTEKKVTKVQKHKSSGVTRTVTKTVRNDSFFNFFNPPEAPEDPEADVDDEIKAALITDFQVGHYIREHIVPRAVLYYTGEIDDDGYDDGEEEECEEEEDDEDDEENVRPFNRGKKSANNAVNPAECKQQ